MNYGIYHTFRVNPFAMVAFAFGTFSVKKRFLMKQNRNDMHAYRTRSRGGVGLCTGLCKVGPRGMRPFELSGGRPPRASHRAMTELANHNAMHETDQGHRLFPPLHARDKQTCCMMSTTGDDISTTGDDISTTGDDISTTGDDISSIVHA